MLAVMPEALGNIALLLCDAAQMARSTHPGIYINAYKQENSRATIVRVMQSALEGKG